MKIIFIIMLFTCYASNVSAATNSKESTVKQITIGEKYARIKLTNMTNMEGCTRQDYYYLNVSSGKNAGTLSVILTAKVTQTPIVIQGNGCIGSYPLISHVYLN